MCPDKDISKNWKILTPSIRAHSNVALVFQISCEDRCLNPQTSPEVRLFWGSKHLLTRYLEDSGRLELCKTWVSSRDNLPATICPEFS